MDILIILILMADGLMNMIIITIKTDNLKSINIWWNNHRPPVYDDLFGEFEELDDGKGFLAINGKIYYYENYGGWYDNYQYYNHYGEPCEPPYQDPLLDDYLSEDENLNDE